MSQYGASVVFDPGTTARPIEAESVVIFAVGAACDLSDATLNRPVVVRNETDLDAAYDEKPDNNSFAGTYPLTTFARAVFRRYGGATLVLVNVLESDSGDPADPADADADLLIGGADGAGGRTGIEVLEDVYRETGLAPTVLTAVGPVTPAVVDALLTKAHGYGPGFRAIVLADATAKADSGLPGAAETIAKKAAPALGHPPYADPQLTLAAFGVEPDEALGDVPAVAHLAGALAAAAGANEGLPASPSNKPFRGVPVAPFTSTDVKALRDAGLVTVQRTGPDGYRFAGNRTAAYVGGQPLAATAEEALVDSFTAARMTANYAANSLLQLAARYVDEPTRRAQIDRVLDAARLFGNRLVADGGSLGFAAEFVESDNPPTELAAGRVVFRARFLPPPPMESITFRVAVDLSYFGTLTA